MDACFRQGLPRAFAKTGRHEHRDRSAQQSARTDRLGLRRVLRRKRQTGGALLHVGLRLRSSRVRRPGDRRAQPRQLSARAEQAALRPYREPRSRRRDRAPRDAPRRRRQRYRDPRRGRAGRLRDGSARRSARRARAGDAAKTPTGASSKRRSRRTAIPSIRSFSATATAESSPRASSRSARASRMPRKPGLQFIDHCVGNVGWGEMDRGATSTVASSVSRSSSRSTTRIFRPNIRRCAPR